MEAFTFFWRTESPFSQWHPCSFAIDGIAYNCAEQYMMYRKAMLFGDERVAARILKAKSPVEQKKLGRQVRNFDRIRWEQICQEVVYEANRAKFAQNQELLRQLLDTKGTTLVEASPYDTIWGVGLAEEDPAIRDRRTWKGTNWLGEILTKLREDFIDGSRRE